MKKFRNFGLTLTRQGWRRPLSDSHEYWYPHIETAPSVATTFVKQGRAQGMYELSYNSNLLA